RLDGEALMANHADPKKASRGLEVHVSGTMTYDVAAGKFTRFDIVAVGDVWGGDWEGGRFARPGRAPLGIALELAQGDSAADRVTPKGMNWKEVANHYFHAERP